MESKQKRFVTLFSYNEGSFLDSGKVRVLNYIIMAIIMIIAVANGNDIDLSFPVIFIILIPAVISIVSVISLNIALGRTQFCEWDYTERQKKKRFTETYIFITFFLCCLCGMGFIIAYSTLQELGFCKISLITLFPPLYFLVQLPFVVTLYYPMFRDELTIAYKIQKRPDGWKENGKEIKPQDEIEEILKRDCRI